MKKRGNKNLTPPLLFFSNLCHEGHVKNARIGLDQLAIINRNSNLSKHIFFNLFNDFILFHEFLH